jgi:general secretion pathway protein N
VQHQQDYISDVSWDLNPLSLLLGSISADVQFGDGSDRKMISGAGMISTGFSFASVDLSDFVLRYPAKELMGKLKLGLPVTLGGQIVFNIDDYAQGAPYCESLHGTMTWRKAQVQVAGPALELGKLDAQLGCQKGELELKVTKKNPLGLQMTSLIGANNKFSVKGFVKPNGDMPDPVHNAMSFLGKADSKGRFALNF